ncbi:MAG: hypothetical protein MK179_11645 [Pirellulaceae bacterium]|nr:hypothetical protein [Pirellulaceae bacterium]
MEFVYLACAAVGGTLLVIQFVTTVVGLGGEDVDFDVGANVPDDLDFGDPGGDAAVYGSTWIFAVISFKTLVAAFTFFGLAGMAGQSAGWTNISALFVALVAGLSAMFMVHWLMQGLHKLNHDGSVRIERAVGKRGTVYVPIPPGKEGEGKVQMRLQNRIVELKAVTSQTEKLPTGASVEVVQILTPTTVEVELISETKIS